MKRVVIAFALFVATLIGPSPHSWGLDEGMYPLSELQQLDLQQLGFELTVEEIFNSEQPSLVNGICRVNGCTGSLISEDGLIVTNHHCAYRAIQSVSRENSDYLKDGFLARDRGEEIPAPGYTVRITESFEDVSARVLSAVDETMDFLSRTKAIEKRRKELEKQAEEQNPGRRAEVAEMFTGKTYVLFLYTYLKDVRLVYAPPASVGNFGGDVDNWEWPRHTGDFTFMRAYVGPDGAPAEVSDENIPFKPKKYIQVAPEGVQENDLIFLLGYPGRTGRHRTAAFMVYEQQTRLPFVIDLYQWQIDVMDKAGAEDRAVALKHASRMRSLANVEKRARGKLKGLRRTDILQRRIDEERRLRDFIKADPDRRAKYDGITDDIASVYQEMAAASSYEYLVNNLKSACRYLSVAYTVVEAAAEQQKPDLERESAYMDRNFDQTQKRLMLSIADLDSGTDRQMLLGMLERLSAVPSARDLPIIGAWLDKPESWEREIANLYQHAVVSNADLVQGVVGKTPKAVEETGGSFLKLAAALHPVYISLREKSKEREGALNRLYGDYIEVKKQFLKTNFVPDANATLRLTYGRVEGYEPEDAVYKSPITTLQGIVDKTTGTTPFVTPEKILDLRRAQDFGSFAHPELNDVPVGILYSADTTGGNSGSPILNAKGQLVGVNFDRAFEATINDFAWDQSYSRSIGVDIRYVLWLLEKYAEAPFLLKEMGVLKD